MCGIFGGICNHNIVPSVVSALRMLEYRGYDSAGILVLTESGVECVKVVGKVDDLEKKLEPTNLSGFLGMGHTRWATHGEPNVVNAHPIKSGMIHVVHNGIVENHAELKSHLTDIGIDFHSQTDTEVLAALIEQQNSSGLSIFDSAIYAVTKAKGSYAFIGFSERDKEHMILCSNGAPLIIGFADEGSVYFASDYYAMSQFATNAILLKDGDVAEIKYGKCRIYNIISNSWIEPKPHPIPKRLPVEKGGYAHFMLKEIYEQPDLLHNLFSKIKNAYIDDLCELFIGVEGLKIIACGTSYYAAYVAKYWIEKICRIPVDVDFASEFRYRSPVIQKNHVCLFISQSGETADTLAALKFVKAQGVKTIALVNAIHSSIASLADNVVEIDAGIEIGVASTKAFTMQLTKLSLITLAIAKQNDLFKMEILDRLYDLPTLVQEFIDDAQQIEKIKRIAMKIAQDSNKVLYMGRGILYPIALEGALKMKELAYIQTEGVPAGELKHGIIALIDKEALVFAMAPQDELFSKISSNIEEICARHGNVVLLSSKSGCDKLSHLSYECIELPESCSITAPMLYAVPLQLLAYYTALYSEHNVDQPRNLAKSVTVE